MSRTGSLTILLALVALATAVPLLARAQEPAPLREEGCTVQLQLATEWTVPHPCVMRREGTRARVVSSGALGVTGTYEMRSTAPRFAGRIACGEPMCAEAFDARIDEPITPFQESGVHGFDGAAIVGNRDVLFRVVLSGSAPRPVQVRRGLPPTVATANIPAIREFAGAWDVRFELDGHWQGSWDARIAASDRGLRLVIRLPALSEVDASVVVRPRGLALAGTFTRNEGTETVSFRGTLERQSDGAYVGRLGPRGPRIELRALSGVPPTDIAGAHVCRVRGETRTFPCTIMRNGDNHWLEASRDEGAPYSLEGPIVGTPVGFRIVWGSLQCLSGDNECMTESMVEFAPDPSVNGWRGYVPLRGRFVEIEMTRGPASSGDSRR